MNLKLSYGDMEIIGKILDIELNQNDSYESNREKIKNFSCPCCNKVIKTYKKPGINAKEKITSLSCDKKFRNHSYGLFIKRVSETDSFKIKETFIKEKLFIRNFVPEKILVLEKEYLDKDIKYSFEIYNKNDYTHWQFLEFDKVSYLNLLVSINSPEKSFQFHPFSTKEVEKKAKLYLTFQ